MVEIRVKIVFMGDEEWEEFIEGMEVHMEEWQDEEYKEYVRTKVRAFEDRGMIFMKRSAKGDGDFRKLLLHELGHAVCDLDHVDRKGDIMNPLFTEWGE